MNERNELLVADIQTNAGEMLKLLDAIKEMTKGSVAAGLVDLALIRAVELENDVSNLADEIMESVS